MQLSLHVQQVHEHFVHVFVGVVSNLFQEPAEGVLDRSGHYRMPVRLDGGQMEDLAPDVHRRNLDALRKDLMQLQQRTAELVDLPLHLWKRGEGKSVPGEDRLPAIVSAAFPWIRDDRLVLQRY